jgi:hypothetical protein
MIPHMQTGKKTAYKMNLAKYVGLLYFLHSKFAIQGK